jgi:hypothetical protein
VSLSAIGTGQPVITKKPLEEDVDYPPPDVPDATDGSAAPALPQLPEPVEEEPEDRVITVYVAPLLIGIASAVVLLVVLTMFWVPAAPQAAPEPTTKLDPTPGRWVPLWGVLIIVCTVLLYCFF